jgi:hypothetical protein
VVVAAVGRRLGFPIKLVKAKCHLLARWEGEGERFNIEVNNTGFDTPPEDYYRQGRYQVSRVTEEDGCFLKSMSPRQELGNFLAQRGYRWWTLGKERPAAEAFLWASILAPRDRINSSELCTLLKQCHDRLLALRRPHFPEVYVKYPPRRFPAIPQSVERDLIHCEVLEDCLENPEHKARWWDPQRRRPQQWLPGMPKVITAFPNQ